MNKRNKTLTTDDEKREFMTIFDQIYNDCHERTMKEMEIINTPSITNWMQILNIIMITLK